MCRKRTCERAYHREHDIHIFIYGYDITLRADMSSGTVQYSTVPGTLCSV